MITVQVCYKPSSFHPDEMGEIVDTVERAIVNSHWGSAPNIYVQPVKNFERQSTDLVVNVWNYWQTFTVIVALEAALKKVLRGNQTVFISGQKYLDYHESTLQGESQTEINATTTA